MSSSSSPQNAVTHNHPVDPEELARELRELIEALDRRMPHAERAGEAAILRDASLLRAKAQKRLEELSLDDAN